MRIRDNKPWVNVIQLIILPNVWFCLMDSRSYLVLAIEVMRGTAFWEHTADAREELAHCWMRSIWDAKHWKRW
jgi:hypothetical protein